MLTVLNPYWAPPFSFYSLPKGNLIQVFGFQYTAYMLMIVKSLPGLTEPCALTPASLRELIILFLLLTHEAPFPGLLVS